MSGLSDAERARITAALDQARAARRDYRRLLDSTTPRPPADDTPEWAWAASLALVHAWRDGAVGTCPHLRIGEVVMILAEAPTMLYCRGCYRDTRATRACLGCGGAAGTTSRFGGVEDVVSTEDVSITSRILCPACAVDERLGPTSPIGTFGPGQ
ncbi:hypothetical protein [Streptomyces sp. CBMA156]|uniref:hypothetical protein n=1 Tax=Streptomyces sp. CBMA156 TaxID=1930280 RepID=UPI001661CA87|nr:hypothetical protein [Streptomyces sp. CBMA156]MBD0673155.1 hypothetical protein [Streptomyces sp. CBMA156]